MAVSLLILHVAPDRDAVTQLAVRLEEAGITTGLVDVQYRLGRAQRRQLRQRAVAARAVVVVISAASADSDALLREVEFTRRVKGGDAQIIPLVIGPPAAGSPFDGLPMDAVVVNELRPLDAVNARDGSDPLPSLRRFLAPASSYPNGYLFISYSTPNRAVVEAYAQGLRDDHHIDVWWFEGRQRAGAHYRRKIMQRIKEARAVIVVLSKRSANSRSVLFEVAYARRVGTPIISIRIGDSADDHSLTAEVRHGAVVYDLRGYPILDGRAGRDPLPDLVSLLGSPERLRADPLPAPARDLRGTLLHKYAVDERIATTESSTVYKAWDRVLSRPVAIKVMLPSSDRPHEQLARFEAEAKRVAQLEHPYIVRLHDSWVDSGQIYLVMNWMPRSLAEEVPGQPLPLKRAARTFAQVAAALTYAHIRGVFHCDLKPGNILLDASGEASLADFGIAQEAHRRAGIVAFSRGYAPPEQLRGVPPQAQTDIYSLAVVLWELLAGRRLFAGELLEVERLQREAVIPSVTTLRPELPAALDEALRRALAPDPAARFPDVPSFRAAIDEAFVLALRASGLPEPEVQLSVRLPELPVTPNPYKFLRPFEEDDAANFFGRERLVAELLERLRLPELDGRVVAVVGPSGSGKSSVVRAGLIPAYRQLAEGAGWRLEVVVIRPGVRPVESLAAALARLRGLVAEELADEIHSGTDGLPCAIDRALANEPTVELLLVIDQLEELFAAGVDPAARRAFLAGLASAVTVPGSRTRLVVTLRADFYGAPLEEPAFAPLMHKRVVNVLPLTEQELEDAIRKPAARAGMGVETALVREMIADVAAQPGQLPLLQFALAQLYDSSVWTVLTLRGYQELGGVEGALTTRADTVYTELGQEEQSLAKQIFLRLVTPGDGTEDTRRRARLAELESLGTGSALVAVTDTTEQHPRALTDDVDPDAPTLAQIAGAEGSQTHGADPDAPTLAQPAAAGVPQIHGADPDAPTPSPDTPAPGAAHSDAVTLDPANPLPDATLVVRAAPQEALALNGGLSAIGYRLSAMLPSGSTTVLQQFGEVRLLSFDRDQVRDEPTVEVAHEVLFHRDRGWLLLREWLSAARDELRTQRRLSAAALDWQDRKRATAYLATGGPLAQFEALAAGSTLALTPLEQDFIAASVAERDRAAAVQEAARQRELEQARQLAAEQAERAEKERELATVANLRAEEQTTANRRLRRRAMVITVALIAAVIAASAAGLFSRQATLNAEEADRQRNEAVAQLQVAESRRLAAEATNLLAAEREEYRGNYRGSSETALLLAIDAIGIDRNPLSYQALQEAVTRRPYEVSTFYGHTDSVTDIEFSPDGTRVVSASGDGTARLWRLDGTTVAVLEGHTDWVNSVAFSPNGMHIVTASVDNTARLWDMSGKLIAMWRGGANLVDGAVFSPDGANILITSGEKALLWELKTQVVVPLVGHTDLINSAEFSPDGRYVLTASWDHTARLWNLLGQTLFTFRGHTDLINSAVFSPDGARVLTASDDQTARLWEQSGKLLAILDSHTSSVQSASFSADGRRIVTASLGSEFGIWTEDGVPLTIMSNDMLTFNHGAIFSPDRGQILVYGLGVTAELWNSSGQSLARLSGHSGRLTDIAFSPDSKHILTGSSDHTIRLWSMMPYPVTTMIGHESAINEVAFNHDGSRILTAGDDSAARLWDTSGNLLVTFSHVDWVPAVAFAPDGRSIATASGDGITRVWDVQGELLFHLKGHTDAVYDVTFSEDGLRILTSSIDGTAKLWARDGKLLATMAGHTDWVYTSTFSPDGAHVLTASHDHTARIWDTKGRSIATLQGHTDKVNSAVYSPDGRFILTASDDGTARLWSAQGAHILTLKGHSDLVAKAVFSPDGQFLLTASEDKTARLWDISGELLVTFSGHNERLDDAQFSPDGILILTTSADNTARLWDLNGRQLSSRINFYAASFTPDGRRIFTAIRDESPLLDFSAQLSPIAIDDWLAAAACRVGRSLTEAEIQAYAVPTPLKFKYEDRQCPPVYSWE